MATEFTAQTTIRLTPEMNASLRELAVKQDTTRAVIVRDILAEYLGQHGWPT